MLHIEAVTHDGKLIDCICIEQVRFCLDVEARTSANINRTHIGTAWDTQICIIYNLSICNQNYISLSIYIYIYIYTLSTHNLEKERLFSMTWIIKVMISKTRFCISTYIHDRKRSTYIHDSTTGYRCDMVKKHISIDIVYQLIIWIVLILSPDVPFFFIPFPCRLSAHGLCWWSSSWAESLETQTSVGFPWVFVLAS